MSDAITPKPYVLEYNPVVEPRSFVWAKVRPLEPADFDISVWMGTTWNDDLNTPKRAIYRCRLTLRTEVYEEIKRVKPLFDRLFNKRSIGHSYRWGGGIEPRSAEEKTPWLVVEVMEEVKYQGAGNQEAKHKRWRKAHDILEERVEKDGLEIIGLKIIEANIEIFGFLEHQCADYIKDTLGWATRIDGYNIEAVDKEADNAALQSQLTVLAAQMEGIEKAIHDRRAAVIRKSWDAKDDCGYPEEVLKAVREKLKEPGVIKDSHVRVLWPTM